ncbi:hypothetical protein [Methylobacterium brachiatum]|uniref:hypothetical protein n=1 Tax=Methylobacterium brachiatum TaxID=269660 RepID=UPI000EFB231B|nr:hypothetical protein [Methylobacterium brachiatum]AYO84706.1 hypothetical protein EBB05_22350 [Methylobacterium brachiatum]
MTTDNSPAPVRRTIAQRLAHVELVRQRVESGRLEELENIVTDLGAAFEDLDAIDAWIETISQQVSGRLSRSAGTSPSESANQSSAPEEASGGPGGKPLF